jgi:hypothetical protein
MKGLTLPPEDSGDLLLQESKDFLGVYCIFIESQLEDPVPLKIMGRHRSLQPLVSLDNLDELEQHRLINSPRSLEACRKEGIYADELLYIPPKAFAQPHLSEELQRIHYDFFEDKRRNAQAIVRRARDQLAVERGGEEFHRSRSSGSLNPHKKLYGDVVEQAKGKHLKMMTRLVNYEIMATEKLKERQRLEVKQAQQQARLEKLRLAEEKREAEERRLMEIERVEKALEAELQARLSASKQFQLEIEEGIRRHQLEEAEANALAQLKAEGENKRVSLLKRVEDNQKAIQAERDRRLKERQASEEDRTRKIESLRSINTHRLQTLSQQRESKRHKVVLSIEARIAHKRAQFERKQETVLQKQLRFLDEQAKSVKHLRSASLEQDQRIKKTRETAEQLLEERRQLILKKSLEADHKVERQRELNAEKIEVKKHEELLRGLKKEWNVCRKRLKEDYQQQQVKESIREDDRRIAQFLKARDRMIQQRLEFNTQHTLQKYEIKEALNRMTVTKKWDTGFLRSISQSDRSLKSSLSQISKSMSPDIRKSRSKASMRRPSSKH